MLPAAESNLPTHEFCPYFSKADGKKKILLGGLVCLAELWKGTEGKKRKRQIT